MTEHTLEQILVLYQMAVTGRPGAAVDNDPARTKELANKIRDVVGNTAITLTTQGLFNAADFAGLAPSMGKVRTKDLMKEYTIESISNIDLEDGNTYKGPSIHSTEYPEEGYCALSPVSEKGQDLT